MILRSSLNSPNPLQTIKVSLIEDNKMVRDCVAKMINRTPDLSTHQQFNSVESYLKYYASKVSQTSQVLLLDISLPGMSGIEGIERILAVHPQLHIIMLSVNDQEEIIKKAIKKGASAYLNKQSSLQVIIQTIRTVVQNSKLDQNF